MNIFPRSDLFQKLLLLLFCLATAAIAQSPSADETARFLAGMPLEGTSLQNFAIVPAWGEHASQMDQAWDESEQQQLRRVRAWAPGALGTAHTAATPMFYFFSGPDFLYPHALFPNAGTYVLCAREPVGSQPDPARIPPAELGPALANFRTALDSYFKFTFFITKDLRKDIGQKHLSGVLPLLEAMIARTGSRIVEVAPVICDRSGAIIFNGSAKGGTSGVCIRFTDAGRREHRLYYFNADLSNGGLKSHEGVLLFCERLGRGQSLLKASSYLTHQGEFTRIRDWLLAHSRTIVQDSSGIPFLAFDPAAWKFRFWGDQLEPIPLFAQYPQPELKAALQAAAHPPLPFGFGYQQLDGATLLIHAQRTGGE